MNPAKVFLFVYDYIYPFIGFPVLAWLWTRDTNPGFAILVMGLPLVFGYLVPGIGTNYLKMWRFKGHWVVGNYFIHHGFIYSSAMGLGLYLAFFPSQNLDGWNILGNMLRTTCVIGFVGWVHDLLGVQEGAIEIYNRPWKRGASPEEIVSYATPLCYIFLGITYSGTASLGYQLLVVQTGKDNPLWWIFLLGLALMTLFTSVPYLLMEGRLQVKRKEPAQVP